MALYVTIDNDVYPVFYVGGHKSLFEHIVNWHNSPIREDADLNGRHVIIQADGDELESIIEKFHNIPYHQSRVQKWTGDFAKFILLNL